MDFSDVEALHADGHDTTAWIQFAQMCRQALYDGHGVPADVSHLVHYTTLGTLTSMLGVVEAAHEKYRLATPGANGVAEEHGGSVGYLRLYDTFSSNDPNEGAFFVNSADAKGSFRHRYNAVWRLFEDRSASPAYQTSLTYVEGRSGSGQPRVLENIRQGWHWMRVGVSHDVFRGTDQCVPNQVR